MSRVGTRPIKIPEGVTVSIEDGRVRVEGPKGKLSRPIPEGVAVAIQDRAIAVTRSGDQPKIRALHGLTRALINNMVEGVTRGFSKSLTIEGIGYRAEKRPFGLELALGFSRPVKYHLPEGITCVVDNNVVVTVEGVDRELVGQVAAEIRHLRPPEPYKGKGIRYVGERVRRKAGKTAAK